MVDEVISRWPERGSATASVASARQCKARDSGGGLPVLSLIEILHGSGVQSTRSELPEAAHKAKDRSMKLGKAISEPALHGPSS